MPARAIIYVKAGITSVITSHWENHLSSGGDLRGSGMITEVLGMGIKDDAGSLQASLPIALCVALTCPH